MVATDLREKGWKVKVTGESEAVRSSVARREVVNSVVTDLLGNIYCSLL
jgi:hypothetical protein